MTGDVGAGDVGAVGGPLYRLPDLSASTGDVGAAKVWCSKHDGPLGSCPSVQCERNGYATQHPSGDVGADVAAVLAEHDHPGEFLTGLGDAWMVCACGHRIDVRVVEGVAKIAEANDAYRAHVADALTPLIAVRVEAAKAEALREAADEACTCFPEWLAAYEEHHADCPARVLLRRAAALDPEGKS